MLSLFTASFALMVWSLGCCVVGFVVGYCHGAKSVGDAMSAAIGGGDVTGPAPGNDDPRGGDAAVVGVERADKPAAGVTVHDITKVN